MIRTGLLTPAGKHRRPARWTDAAPQAQCPRPNHDKPWGRAYCTVTCCPRHDPEFYPLIARHVGDSQ